MSGPDCKECGNHFMSCTCNKLEPKLTIREICMSEEIQCQLAPIITNYLDFKRPLIDALSFILSIISNDYKNNLEIYKNCWGIDGLEEL